jgi:hypothetical protein
MMTNSLVDQIEVAMRGVDLEPMNTDVCSSRSWCCSA